MAPVDFSGKWEEVKREGFDAIFKNMGIPDEMQKKIEEFKFIHNITQDGDKITVSATLPMQDKEHTVTMVCDGTQQEIEDPLTKTRIKCTPRWDGDKMVGEAEYEGGMKGHMERYMDGDQMVNTFDMGGNTATLYMKKC